MNISIAVLIIILVMMAIPKIGRFNIKIWQLMLSGAAAVLLAREISWQDALLAIDIEVMVFLFGMFVVGQAMVASGYLYFLAYRLVSRLQSVAQLVLAILFGAAFGSALLMNDTLAIVGTPLVLRLAHEHKINSGLLLLTLAYSITLGSVFSPLGNPQNFLIASHSHLSEPFLTFFGALAVPTLINLGITYLLLRWAYRQQFAAAMPLVHTPVTVLDENLAGWAKVSLGLLLALIALKILFVNLGILVDIHLSHIAVIAALPVLLFSPARCQLLKHLDWATLVFFAALFVLMASVWQTGLIQLQVQQLHVDLTTVPAILMVSASVSQLISNVPLVALYLPMVKDLDVNALMALAAGSTVAGNFLILGAASNVIIIQHAQKHSATLNFFEFARLGIPLGLLNLLVYWLWLSFCYH
ncbi:MAG: SLC13 family permease [Methylococcales bacterium]